MYVGNTVPAGTYVVTLTVGNQSFSQPIRVIKVDGYNDVVLYDGTIIRY
jgi:hypothetical protein